VYAEQLSGKPVVSSAGMSGKHAAPSAGAQDGAPAPASDIIDNSIGACCSPVPTGEQIWLEVK
jgi:hypothetical protein